jgi:hypothetical protein
MLSSKSPYEGFYSRVRQIGDEVNLTLTFWEPCTMSCEVDSDGNTNER